MTEQADTTSPVAAATVTTDQAQPPKDQPDSASKKDSAVVAGTVENAEQVKMGGDQKVEMKESAENGDKAKDGGDGSDDDFDEELI